MLPNNPNNPMQKNPERAFALQKYLLLHSQHDAIQRHIDRVTATSLSSPVPDHVSTGADRHRNSSVSSSSSSDSDQSISPLRHHMPRRRRGSLPNSFQFVYRENKVNSLPPVLDDARAEEVEEVEQKLKSVNQEIKTTLTDLLNCESVKRDSRYRMWVQTRLMDTEKELKERRSRSCERRRSEDIYS